MLQLRKSNSLSWIIEILKLFYALLIFRIVGMANFFAAFQIVTQMPNFDKHSVCIQ